MCLGNKHEKFLTYCVFATLILLPCSSIPCPRTEASRGETPAWPGRPSSKTKVCANLEVKWTSQYLLSVLLGHDFANETLIFLHVVSGLG